MSSKERSFFKRYWWLFAGAISAVTLAAAVTITNTDGYLHVYNTTASAWVVDYNRSNTLNINFTEDTRQPIVLSGNATVWNDLAVMSTGLAPGVFAPTLTGFNNTAFYCYAGTIRNEYSYGATELFHDWKEGTTLYPHLHTLIAANVPANYSFMMNYTLYDSTHQKNGITFINITDGNNSMGIHGFTTPIDATGFKIGSTIGFTITRLQDNAFDTYTDCVGVAQVSFHYEIDTLGSAGLYTK